MTRETQPDLYIAAGNPDDGAGRRADRSEEPSDISRQQSYFTATDGDLAETFGEKPLSADRIDRSRGALKFITLIVVAAGLVILAMIWSG